MSTHHLGSEAGEVRTNGISPDSEWEFQYMLHELETSQTRIGQAIQRYEQLVTFYLTGTTAIGGAIVIVATSSVTYPVVHTLTGLLLIALAGFGTGTFLRICTAKVGIAVGQAFQAINREYFARRFPGVLSYVTPHAYETRYRSWRGAAFTRQVVVLLNLMCVANSTSLALGVCLLLGQTYQLLGFSIHWPLRLVLSLGVLVTAAAASGLYLRGRMLSAESHTRYILDSAGFGLPRSDLK